MTKDLKTVLIEESLKKFRKEMVEGYGPISNGDNYPQEAETWVNGGVEEVEDFLATEIGNAVEKTIGEVKFWVKDNIHTFNGAVTVPDIIDEKELSNYLSTLTKPEGGQGES